MGRRSALWLALCAGCGGAAATPAAPCPPPVATPASAATSSEPPPEAEPPPAFALALAITDEGATVTSTARGADIDAWVGEHAENVEAEDASGALAIERAGAALRFDRPVRPPLTLRYRIGPPAHFSEARAFGYAIHLDGRTLLLPPGAPAGPITIRIETEDERPVATTLGVGAAHALEARPIDLRDVVFAVGRHQRARFVERQARDVVLSFGQRVYDLRWVGAEIALIRDHVRTFFGAIDAAEHPTLLLSRPAGDRVPPYAAARSGLGLRVFIREDAPWNSAARLPVSQVMARRYLGGLLRFRGPDGEPERWASLGFTRWVAQEVLSAMGTLTSHERAAELTMLEGAVALDDGGGAPLPAMARGALYAAGLDARLRERDAAPRSLQHLLFPLLRRAQDDPDPVPRADFEAVLREALGEAEVARFREEVLGRASVSVPAEAFGRCLRRGRAVHRRFALGFEAPPPHAARIEVRGVTPDGPAARAGLRDGMQLDALSYVPGDPETTVRATVAGDPVRTVEWRPFDRTARGVAWTRVPRVDEEDCAR